MVTSHTVDKHREPINALMGVMLCIIFVLSYDGQNSCARDGRHLT